MSVTTTLAPVDDIRLRPRGRGSIIHAVTSFARAKPMGAFGAAILLLMVLMAIFAQQLSDPVVLSAVNEIETLASGLSGKIWQKITLLDRARRE